MIGEILTGLAKANLAAGAAILVVLAMRTLMRPRFGAGAAYLMWLAPLMAGLAVLAPHPAVRTVMTPMVQGAASAVEAFVATAPAAGPSAGPDLASLAFGLWVLGALAAAALLLRRQAMFLRAMGRLEAMDGAGVFRAEHASVGPAVVGVLRPRIVAPADFETRFDPAERALILAHEGVHLRRGDAGVNALACAAQCLCWFNPLVHLAAHLLRIDQELACDATVIDRFPAERRTYAELLLKTQLATQALPLGCHWPAGSAHPLKARIAMLASPLPARAMRAMGLVVVASVTLGAGAMAWAAQPAASAATIAASPGAAQRAEALRLLALHPSYTCDPALEAKGVGCKIITQSPWLAVPTREDVARAFPPGAREAGDTARVNVTCEMTPDGLLRGCAVLNVTVQVPEGEGASPALQDAFGDAALKVMGFYQARIPNLPNTPARPGRATLHVDFGTVREPLKPWDGPPAPPGAVRVSQAQAPAAGPPAGFAEPRGPQATPFQSIWLKKPTGADLVALYPPDAVAKGFGADVLMACQVGADGRLNACEIKRVDISGDRPPDQAADPDFGAATLALAKEFQMKPVDPQGHPTAGTEIRIPVRFRLPAPPQPVTPPQ